jgi:hypothetical protein
MDGVESGSRGRAEIWGASSASAWGYEDHSAPRILKKISPARDQGLEVTCSSS